MTDVYLLLDSSCVWGVFSDKDLLYGMYSNLRKANPVMELKIQKLRLNSNIVLEEWKNEAEITKDHHPNGGDSVLNKDITQVPPDLKIEFTKLQTRLSEFKTNLSVFKNMLDDGVLTLDSEGQQIPLLLRDKFHILCDIIKYNVPEADAFGYFADRYYYKPQPVFD